MKAAQSCQTLQPHGLHSPWNFPGQNTGVGSLSLLQGIIPNPGIEPRSPSLQVDSLPAELPGKSWLWAEKMQIESPNLEGGANYSVHNFARVGRISS